MLISPINNFQYTKKSELHTLRPNFKANLKTATAPIGVLKRDTKFLIEDIMHAYRDILAKLERKTEKGLEILAQNYPDIRLGKVLAFHNCGEGKNTIIINTGEVEKNRGLIYLSRRLGTRRSEKHTVLEAFMLDGNERLIKEFNNEHAERFPSEREYYTQEEIESLGKEENLNNLLQELDFAMLKFRKFLDKNMDEHLKLPDGKIPYQVASNIREAFKICNEIQEYHKTIPYEKLTALKKEFSDIVVSVGGLRSLVFKNIGEEGLTINLSHTNRENENLKRLSVYDKKGRLKKTFLIKNEEKFISNLAKTRPLEIPLNYSYADTKKIEEKYLPEFEKYLNLYINKLNEYKLFIENYFKNEQNKKRIGKLNTETHFALKDSLRLYETAKSTLQKINPKESQKIKRLVGNLSPNFEKKGIWFNGFENNKLVQILPLNSKKQENLCRITIIDNETQETKMYLIKDFSHIVKNYNPNNPGIIPVKLFFANIAEIEDANLESCCRFIKGKLEELNAQADYAFENRNMPPKIKQTDASKKISEKDKTNSVIRDCKKQFAEALRHLDLGIENFNKSLQEIQDKIAQLYAKKENL